MHSRSPQITGSRIRPVSCCAPRYLLQPVLAATEALFKMPPESGIRDLNFYWDTENAWGALITAYPPTFQRLKIRLLHWGRVKQQLLTVVKMLTSLELLPTLLRA